MRADHHEQLAEREPVDAGLIAGRYKLLRRLGRGSSGEVFVARDESIGLQVALKRQLPKEPDRLRLRQRWLKSHSGNGL